MRTLRTILGRVAGLSTFTWLPYPVSAHEVYVLPKSTVAQDIATPSPNPFSSIPAHLGDFLSWSVAAILIIAAIFLISVSRACEQAFDFFLKAIKRYAPLVARITVGGCFIACAHYQALFGPELPFSSFGGNSALLTVVLYCLGGCFLLGLFARVAAVVALIVFGAAVFEFGGYMFTYLNYLGEILVMLLLGSGAFSVDRWIQKGAASARTPSFLEPYAFLIVRVCFGVAIFFASFYAKFLHSNLALDTVNDYHLANFFFHFDPLFIVLGAFLIESLIGLFFIIGFEIRFAAIFFLAFLSLSLWYFGEVIWPHLVLIGLNLAMIAHGYDRYTLGAFLGRKTHLEPIL
ncbi:MAG: DoxX family membrane protein [Patescibacteria group bacterium]|nr:DoxX family membrane protein [Patescibacteria group bacterium]